MRKFKHKQTGVIAEHFNDVYYIVDKGKINYSIILKGLVENSADWEDIKEYPKIISFRSLYPFEKGLIITYKGDKCIKRSDGNSVEHTIDFKTALNDSKIEIYQVATSETEIFTVGDKVCWNWCASDQKFYTIEGFKLMEDNLFQIRFEEMKHHLFDLKRMLINSLRHYKEPLFVSEDGVEIFEGDDVYFVRVTEPSKLSTDKQFVPKKYGWNNSGDRVVTNDYKWFSTEEAAKDWIEENKPRFSKKDIEDGLYGAKQQFTFNGERMFGVDYFKQKLGI